MSRCAVAALTERQLRIKTAMANPGKSMLVSHWSHLQQQHDQFNIENQALGDPRAKQQAFIRHSPGTPTVPEIKVVLGYRYEKDKFSVAGLTPEKSEIVDAPRIKECPAQMEAEMMREYEMMNCLSGEAKGFTLAIEVRALKTYVLDKLRLAGHANRIDPQVWRPMIMSFQYLYGLKDERPEKSTLANIEEELYRLPDV